MPTPRTITCTIGRTINTGNYSSLRVEWTEEWLLDEGEDVEEARGDIRTKTRSEVNSLQKGMGK